MASTAIKPRGKDRNDFQHILGQIFLERGIDTLIDDEHFDIFGFADRKHQFRAKTQQTILMGGTRRPTRPSMTSSSSLLRPFLW